MLIIKKASGLVGVYNMSDDIVAYDTQLEIQFNNYNDFDGHLKPFQSLILKDSHV